MTVEEEPRETTEEEVVSRRCSGRKRKETSKEGTPEGISGYRKVGRDTTTGVMLGVRDDCTPEHVY